MKEILQLIDPDPRIEFGTKITSPLPARLLTLDYSDYGQALYHYRDSEGPLLIPRNTFEFMAKMVQELRALPLNKEKEFRRWTEEDVKDWFALSMEIARMSGRNSVGPFELVNGIDKLTRKFSYVSKEDPKRLPKSQAELWTTHVWHAFRSEGRLPDLLDFAEVYISKDDIEKLYFETTEQIVALAKDPEAKSYFSRKTKGHEVGTIEMTLNKDLVEKISTSFAEFRFNTGSLSRNQKREKLVEHAENYTHSELVGQPIEKDSFLIRSILIHYLGLRMPREVKKLLLRDAYSMYPTMLKNEVYAHVIEHLHRKGYTIGSIQVALYYIFLAME